MKNYDDVFCPLTKSGCKAGCAWYCDGKCALVVLNERMVDATVAINHIQWAIKDSAQK